MKNKFLFLLFFIAFLTVKAQSEFDYSRELMEQGKLDLAETILLKKVKNQPVSPVGFSLLGDIYSFQKDWNKAIDFYSRAVELAPNNPEFQFKLGGAYGMKALSIPKIEALVYIGDIKKHLEKAASLDPNQIESRRALVELYVQLPGFLGGSMNKAKNYADELKEVSPINAALANLFIAKEEGSSQLNRYYDRIFKLYKNSAVQNNNLNYEVGKIAAEHNINSNYGIELLDKYIKNYSYKDIYSLEWAYYRKAQIYTNLDLKEPAAESINKALAIKADFKEALKEKQKIEGL